jgi:hypothetical protein
MAERTRTAAAAPGRRLDVRPGQTLIMVPWRDGDEEVVSYFNDADEARAFTGRRPGESALSVLGAWSDLDWEEFLDYLDRIKAESKPSPPLTDDDLGL